MRPAVIGMAFASLMFISSTASAAGQTGGLCVSLVNGKVRAMPAEGCAEREQAIEWNLRGPAGPEGPQGPTGPQGPQGPQGSQGPQGAQGAQGAQGERGLTGQTGAQGIQGERGLTGQTGAQGIQGDRGLTGPRGAQGIQGEAGPAGPQGPQGPQGADGKPGPKGGLVVEDADGREVGVLANVLEAYVVRPAGDDMVIFIAPKSGFTPGRTIFFHENASCSGPRLMATAGGQGLAYSAIVHGNALFYTKSLDPYATRQVVAAEIVAPAQDPTQPGTCVEYDGGTRTVGEVTTFVDRSLGALRAPFRIR